MDKDKEYYEILILGTYVTVDDDNVCTYHKCSALIEPMDITYVIDDKIVCTPNDIVLNQDNKDIPHMILWHGILLSKLFDIVDYANVRLVNIEINVRKFNNKED